MYCDIHIYYIYIINVRYIILYTQIYILYTHKQGTDLYATAVFKVLS